MASLQSEPREPDRKRPRIEEPECSHSPPNFTNHPSLYFGDGNVILCCQQTYFRVHRTLLTRSSPVLGQILAEHDTNGGDQFRGCVLVSLDDDVDDMEQLLNKIYDGFDIDISKLTANTFPTLASLLRLTLKYQIQRPQKTIFDLFRREWPSTLEKYDVKMASARAIVAAEGANCEEYTVIHPATVIALLRECDYTSEDLFAPLFYDLSTHLWQFSQPVSGYHFDGLSLSDIQRFTVGVNKLRALHVREARCPTDAAPHHACHSALVVGWCGEAYNVLHYQGNDICHPIENWTTLISRTKLHSQPNSPIAREYPGPQAPPPYNHPLGGGGEQQEYLGLGHPFAGVRRGLAVPPVYDHHIAAGHMYGFNGFAQGYPALHVPPVAPPPLVLHPHQPRHPGHALRFAHPIQPQQQPQALQPLFENLCGSCRQAIIQSMETSRRRIWDALPELFELV